MAERGKESWLRKRGAPWQSVSFPPPVMRSAGLGFLSDGGGVGHHDDG